MNKQERERFGRVQRCLGDINSLCPFNQGSPARKAIVCDCVQEAGDHLYQAISCIGFGDYSDADDQLDRAEQVIVRAKANAAETEAKHFARPPHPLADAAGGLPALRDGAR